MSPGDTAFGIMPLRDPIGSDYPTGRFQHDDLGLLGQVMSARFNSALQKRREFMLWMERT